MAKTQTKAKTVAKKAATKTKKAQVKKVSKVIQKKVVKKVVRKTAPKKVVKAKAAPKTKQAKKPAAQAKKVEKKVVKKPAKKVIPKKVPKTKVAAEKKTDTKVLQPAKPKDENKIPVKFAAYTLPQYQLYLKTIKEWSTKTNQQIKDALRANLQSMSGNKDEILNKLADGVVLGQIPRCPHCFGGRPKFNQSTGVYFCVGYRDDTDFKFCNKTITDLPRTPWQS